MGLMQMSPYYFDSRDADGNAIFLSVGLPVLVALAMAGTRPLRRVCLCDLSVARIQAEGADLVACPLIAGATDALEVIVVLHAAGFAGTLLVVAPPLPNPGMVEAELRAAARSLRVRLVSM